MNDSHIPEPGMCHAFGCPRLGTLSADTLGGGRWYCGAHFRGNAGQNDAVTSILRRDHVLPIVATINDIRSCYGKPQWYAGTRVAIGKRLRAIKRKDLLPAGTDIGVSGWLARLERAVDEFAREAGQQQLPVERTEPTASVPIPAHVSDFFPAEAD